MAAAVLQPQAEALRTAPLSADILQSGKKLTIQDEVRLNQELLRTRLEGAISKPPPDVPESELPNVPLIDLGPSFNDSHVDKKAVATQIRDACVTSGFFQISNHGIPDNAITGILKQAEAFFHRLTPQQKQALHITHNDLFRGYEAGGDTYVNPDDGDASAEVQVETKEGYNWAYEPELDILNDSPGKHDYVELDGKPSSHPRRCNVWPSEELLPGFKAAVTEYYARVINLARHLLRLFALSLSLDEDYFDPVVTHPGGIARLLYYPPQSAEQLAHKESKLGLGAHTDYECFTLLLSTSHPGLEILFPPSPQTNNKPLWTPCPVRPGTLTVNIADFFMRWTNGLYKSTIHRVVSRPLVETNAETGEKTLKGSEARYSVPFFFGINYDDDVEPLPEEVVGKSTFQNMKCGEYVLARLQATSLDART